MNKLSLLITVKVCLGIIIGFILAETLRPLSSPAQSLRLTQNSRFVVENVRADTTGWKYELENLNLTASPNLSTLIVQTDNPIGYAVGDTLSLIQHKNLQQ